MLARVAAGLNFASKHIDNGQRMKGLVYAAFALKDYLTLTTKGNWTVGPSGGELTVLGPGDIQSDEWKSVWAHLGGFDSSRFAYVLVTGGAVHNLTTPAKEVLARLPWSLVFDLDPSTGDGGLLSSALEIQEALSRRPSEIVGYNATEEPSFSRTLPWVMLCRARWFHSRLEWVRRVAVGVSRQSATLFSVGLASAQAASRTRVVPSSGHWGGLPSQLGRRSAMPSEVTRPTVSSALMLSRAA